jgi:carboxymethylenebutenolidase
MTRLKASDFDQELLILFDAYVHGAIDRRGFLDKARKFAVGGVTAAMLLDALSPKFAEAQQVKPDDPRLRAEFLPYPSPNGYDTTRGYLVRPAKATGRCRACSSSTRTGGSTRTSRTSRVASPSRTSSPSRPTRSRRSAGTLARRTRRARSSRSSTSRRRARISWPPPAGCGRIPDVSGRVGVVGFCYGGGIAHMLAYRAPELAAAVPFYGNSPDPSEAAQVKVPLLVHLAEQDQRINAAWPAYEAALKAAGAGYEMHMYPGTQHGFHNDTTPRYDEAAAKLAWNRTLAFFNRHLR